MTTTDGPTTAVSTRAAEVAVLGAPVRPAGPTSTMRTQQFVVRPVRNGRAAPGFRVVSEDDGGPTQCPEVSPVAVSPNVRFCGSSALDTVACWHSAAPSYVLCLRSPFTRVLARIEFGGSFAPIAAPVHPSPQALVLDDGTRCLIRDGGAWNSVPGHPKWYGQYGCTGGVDVYGPVPDGIDRTAPMWTVHTVAATNPTVIRSHPVTKAYFVGTA